MPQPLFLPSCHPFSALKTEVVDGFDVLLTKDYISGSEGTVIKLVHLTKAIEGVYAKERGGGAEARPALTFDEFCRKCGAVKDGSLADVYGSMLLQVQNTKSRDHMYLYAKIDVSYSSFLVRFRN